MDFTILATTLLEVITRGFETLATFDLTTIDTNVIASLATILSPTVSTLINQYLIPLFAIATGNK